MSDERPPGDSVAYRIEEGETGVGDTASPQPQAPPPGPPSNPKTSLWGTAALTLGIAALILWFFLGPPVVGVALGITAVASGIIGIKKRRRPTELRMAIGGLVIGLFGLFLGAATLYSGTQEGFLYELKIGDCVDPDAGQPGGSEPIEAWMVVSCAAPHWGKVWHKYHAPSVSVDAAEAAEYERQCLPHFQPYVGSSFDDSQLDPYILWDYDPSVQGFAIMCVAHMPDGMPALEGSLKAAASDEGSLTSSANQRHLHATSAH